MRGAQRVCSAVRLRADEKVSATVLVAWLQRFSGVVWSVGVGSPKKVRLKFL